MNTMAGIVMGSTSDWDVMKEAAQQLKDFGVAYEARALSAHRTPAELEAWIKDMERRGCKAFIAGAGGAAHLAGVVAAQTLLPVLGVPIPSKYLQGPGFAAVDRADAQGHTGRDLRHRRGRRGQRRAVRRRHARGGRRSALDQTRRVPREAGRNREKRKTTGTVT